MEIVDGFSAASVRFHPYSHPLASSLLRGRSRPFPVARARVGPVGRGGRRERVGDSRRRQEARESREQRPAGRGERSCLQELGAAAAMARPVSYGRGARGQCLRARQCRRSTAAAAAVRLKGCSCSPRGRRLRLQWPWCLFRTRCRTFGSRSCPFRQIRCSCGGQRLEAPLI